MSRKALMLFLPAAALFLFSLQGCFSNIPVNRYSVKQEKPIVSAKAVQAKPAKKAAGKMAGRTESSGKRAAVKSAPQAEKPDSTMLEKLYRKTENLSRKLDAQERRIMKLEDEIKTNK